MNGYIFGNRIDEVVYSGDVVGGSLSAHRWPLENHLGSVVVVVDESAVVKATNDYTTAYGETAQTGEAYPYGFTGRRYIEDLELYDYRARWYEPKLGRFLQRDPLGHWEDHAAFGNPYVYGGGDAINSREPLGLSSESECADTERERITLTWEEEVQIGDHFLSLTGGYSVSSTVSMNVDVYLKECCDKDPQVIEYLGVQPVGDLPGSVTTISGGVSGGGVGVGVTIVGTSTDYTLRAFAGDSTERRCLSEKGIGTMECVSVRFVLYKHERETFLGFLIKNESEIVLETVLAFCCDCKLETTWTGVGRGAQELLEELLRRLGEAL